MDCTCRSLYSRPISKTPGLINPEKSPELNVDLSKLARNKKIQDWCNCRQEKHGKSYGTGFIIDADRGIIATNAHVTGISPSNVRINFYNGSFTQANKLYFDPVHDFGFYQLDPQILEFKLQSVECGSWNDLSMGDEPLFISNNVREEYSVKFGTVAYININKGERHSSYIHGAQNLWIGKK